MIALNSEIQSRLIKAGASLVGFADISALPADVRGSVESAISIAAALDVSVIKEISEGPTQRYYQEYKRVNEFLSSLCASAVDDLKGRGHNAVAIEPTIEIGGLTKKTLTTPLPHKTVATLAGLGWIGKSALLITEQYGPAIRLATVLTDAPFKAGNAIDDSRCGDCTKCVDRCPAKAISGKNWMRGMEREFIYDAHACCDEATSASGRIQVPATICGICINACPWTQKYISRQQSPL
jgi:epoxyqueuosine reductase QueG